MWLYYTAVKELQLWLCGQSLDSQPLIQGSYLDTMAIFSTGHSAVTYKNVQECYKDTIFPITTQWVQMLCTFCRHS